MNDKPYPIEGNFEINPQGMSLGEGSVTNSQYEPTQAKYAVRGSGESIYRDETRETADDEKACAVAETGTPAAKDDSSQGGAY